VRVIIIGQDPYHSTNGDNSPIATGLSFSVNKGARVPPSLKNIYKELVTSVKGIRPPQHGNLDRWATQGVLMLNKCLTVDPHRAGSHKDVWCSFIYKVLLGRNFLNGMALIDVSKKFQAKTSFSDKKE